MYDKKKILSAVDELRTLPNDVLFADVCLRLEKGHAVEMPFSGRSMRPLLQEGRDVIILEPLTPDTPLQRYDVVLFRYKGEYLLHRILRIEGETITARGDSAYIAEKETFHSSDVVAKLVAVRNTQTGKLTHCDSLKWKLLSRRKLLWKQLKRTAKRLLKRQVALALLVVMAVVLSACEGTPLGDGYYYTNDYPYGVCKRISSGVGEVVIPPSHAWTDTSWTPVCADIVVRVYWDDTTILAVSCYGDDVSAEDTTCWKLNKKSGEVVEITPDEMHRRTSQGKMRTDYIIDRYKK